MKYYILTIMFLVAGHKLSAWCGVSPAYNDVVKFFLQTEEENGKKKVHQNSPEDQEKNIHETDQSATIILDLPFVFSSLLNSYKEISFVDHPFTPPDLA